ncbi:11422_t:CDS:2, partial [Dentiscutata heterogama]
HTLVSQKSYDDFRCTGFYNSGLCGYLMLLKKATLNPNTDSYYFDTIVDNICEKKKAKSSLLKLQIQTIYINLTIVMIDKISIELVE